MSDDLYRKLEGQLIALRREFNEYRNANPLENSTIRSGRLRLIGGTLRVDSGGRVQIVGTLDIDGRTTTTGIFDVNGPWDLAGDGTITGDVSVAGNVTATGVWTQIGAWHLNGDGTITGDVDITGILTLMSELRVSSIGKIIVGSMVIDPANGGSVVFPGGAIVKAGSSGGISVSQGDYAAVVTSAGASVGRVGRSISVTESGFRMDGLPTGSPGNGTPAGNVYVDGTGYLRRSTGS